MSARLLDLPFVALPLALAVTCVDDVGAGKVAAEVIEPTAPTSDDVEGSWIPVDTSRSPIHAGVVYPGRTMWS